MIKKNYFVLFFLFSVSTLGWSSIGSIDTNDSRFDSPYLSIPHVHANRYEVIHVPVTIHNTDSLGIIDEMFLQVSWNVPYGNQVLQFNGISYLFRPDLNVMDMGGSIEINQHYGDILNYDPEEGDTLMILEFEVIGNYGGFTPVNVDFFYVQSAGIDYNFNEHEHGSVYVSGPIPFTLNAQETHGERFSEVVVPVIIEHVADVDSISDFFVQLVWDETVATFIGVENLIYPESNIISHGSGHVEVDSYIHSETFSIQPGDTIFSLRLQLVGASGSSTIIDLESFSAISSGQYIEEVFLDDGMVRVTGNVDPLSFLAGNESGAEMDEVIVPIRVLNFDNIDSFNFSITWDATVATYVGIETLHPSLFAGLYAEELSFFFQDNLVTLPDSSVIAYLTFRLTGEAGDSTALTIISSGNYYSHNYIGSNNLVTIDGSLHIEASTDSIIFVLPTFSAGRLEKVNVPIRVVNFVNVDAFEFSLTWDTSVATILEVTNNHHALQVVQNGDQLHFDFIDDALDLPDSTIIANISFGLEGPVGSTTELQIEDLRVMFVNGWQESYNYGLIPGSITITDEIQYLNSIDESVHDEISYFPMPFNDHLRISFHSGQSQAAEISVLSFSGRVVHKQLAEVVAGNNELTIASSRWLPGMYVCEVKMQDVVITKRIIKN